MRQKKFQMSIVTPFYNEAEGGMIDIFFKTIIAECEKHTKDWEIIAIDDGSGDQTFDILKSYHQKNKNIKIIKLSRNFGKEAALTAGLRHTKGDIIVPIDADLQDPPELICDMIKYWQQGYDVVIPVRKSRDDPFLKKANSRFILLAF